MDCMEAESSKERTDCLGRKPEQTLYSCKSNMIVYAYSRFHSKSYSEFYSKSTNPIYAKTCNWDSAMNAMNAKNSAPMPLCLTLYSPERAAITSES
jgi:hypothetical protein